MPRVSVSTDYLLGTSCRALDPLKNRFDRIPPLIRSMSDDEKPSALSPSDIDEILSRKLYEQLKARSRVEQCSKQKYGSNVSSPSAPALHSLTTTLVDPELMILIDRFFSLTYQNTIPMVNLLATAVATNFLQENIRELDTKLQEQQSTTHISVNIKRGSSLLYELENDEDDDDVSWTSAPT